MIARKEYQKNVQLCMPRSQEAGEKDFQQIHDVGYDDTGWGTRVYLWRSHVDIWQKQYNIVKLKNKI